MKQLIEEPSGEKSTLLNDASVTEKLIAANAMIGFAPKSDKVGATCALRHTIATNGGSIGHRQDGRANHSLNLVPYLHL